jgi:hypothetical protein
MTFDLAAEVERIKASAMSYPNKVIALMHTYNTDLEIQGADFAKAKAEHDRLKAIHTINKRYGRDGLAPEKSGEMCSLYAESQDDVAEADLRYRLAEQMVAADKSKLNILHAELEKWRTEQANERAADSFTARTGT